MSKLLRSAAFALLFLLAALALTACQTSASTPPPTVPGISVDIESDTCPGISVAAGDQVTWNNKGQDERLIRVFDQDGEQVFAAESLQPGDAASFTFTQAGSFTYACSLDGESTGIITVEP